MAQIPFAEGVHPKDLKKVFPLDAEMFSDFLFFSHSPAAFVRQAQFEHMVLREESADKLKAAYGEERMNGTENIVYVSSSTRKGIRLYSIVAATCPHFIML